jgi:sec-independent protein translocase protein TatB
MFDISWSEIFVIVVLAVVVIGPKDLPRVMRMAGRWMRKARLMAAEFREGIEKMAEEAELDEVKKSIHHVSNFDPARAIQNTIDPTGNVPQPLLKDNPVSPKVKSNKAKSPAVKTLKPKAPIPKAAAAKAPSVKKPPAKKPPVKTAAASGAKTSSGVNKAPVRKAAPKGGVKP